MSTQQKQHSRNVRKASVPTLQQTIVNILLQVRMNPGLPFAEISSKAAGPSKTITDKVRSVIEELRLFDVLSGFYYCTKLMKAGGEKPIYRLTRYTPSPFVRDVLNAWHIDIASKDRDQPKGPPVEWLNDLWSRHVFTGMSAPLVYLHDVEQRLYSYGNRWHFQGIKKENRPYIYIDGERTVYIDIRSSQLAIYLALHGQLPHEYGDLYASDRFPREVSKHAFVKMIGGERVDNITWHHAEGKDPVPGYFWNYSCKEVVQELLTKYPCLSQIAPGDRLRVSHAEADIMNDATFILNRNGVICLPISDGCLGKAIELEQVLKVIGEQSRRVLGTILQVSVKEGELIDEQEMTVQDLIDMVLEQFTVQATGRLNAKVYTDKFVDGSTVLPVDKLASISYRGRGAEDIGDNLTTGRTVAKQGKLRVDYTQIHALRETGLSIRAIADALSIAKKTVERALKQRTQPTVQDLPNEIIVAAPPTQADLKARFLSKDRDICRLLVNGAVQYALVGSVEHFASL